MIFFHLFSSLALICFIWYVLLVLEELVNMLCGILSSLSCLFSRLKIPNFIVPCTEAIIPVLLFSISSVLPLHFRRGKNRTSCNFQAAGTPWIYSAPWGCWCCLGRKAGDQVVVTWHSCQSTVLLLRWQGRWPSRALGWGCGHSGEGQWGGPGTPCWAKWSGDLTCWTCCLVDHEAGRHRTCRAEQLIL